jgi:hypothetical protein
MVDVDSGITMSTKTICPLFKQRKQISMVTSVAEYKAAASMSTRTIGIIVLFVARIVELL